MTTLLPYQTTELSDEIDPCEKSRLEGHLHEAVPGEHYEPSPNCGGAE